MRSIIIAIILLCFSSLNYSQTINVHINNGTVQTFNISEIDSITFTTSQQFVCGTSQVTYESKTYNTVLIGEQCWLKENLDVGTMIQGSQNLTNNGVIEKYCYNNDPNNCTTYGALYQWNEAMQYGTNGAQGICPSGWHIVTLEEFWNLRIEVNYDANALKAIGQGTGTNTSGFSALLAGFFGASFININYSAHFWSSYDGGNPTNAYWMYLCADCGDIELSNVGGNKDLFSFSVRCVKD